ncbi:MAG TPA: tetratricopeptide repeat protein, partial [bacterium]|nr:tetratricopeptide repeat protein [bacterium]
DAGNNDGAIGLFLQAIELDPADGDAYYGLGYAYHAKGQKDKARNYYQRALQSRLKEADKADIRSILEKM